jgi:hypothetical protein
MATFRVRVYENLDVRWIELAGAAAATPSSRVREEVSDAFEREDEDHGEVRRYVLDLSQVLTVGSPTLEAILDAVPQNRDVALIPPPERGWFGAVSRRIDLSMPVFANEKHALLALGLETRGTLLDRPDENRQHLRVETAIKSRIWFDHPKGPRFGRALITNLSKTGAYLTRLDCEIGPDEFRYFASGAGPLVIDIPIDMERGHVRSRVVRVDTLRGLPQLGVQFEEMEPAMERAIARYIAARCPEDATRVGAARKT